MVGLVIVSHSELIARGVMELCRQMAPNVPMAAAGGLPGGEIGTDFERIYEAIASVGGDDGVAVLFDLGSALMTTEMVVEQFEDFPVRLVNAPIGRPYESIFRCPAYTSTKARRDVYAQISMPDPGGSQDLLRHAEAGGLIG